MKDVSRVARKLNDLTLRAKVIEAYRTCHTIVIAKYKAGERICFHLRENINASLVQLILLSLMAVNQNAY